MFAGPVTFANPAALNTTASFTGQGDFTLRLTADDGMSTVPDDLGFNNLDPFAQWQAAKFAGGSSHPESGPEDDPDTDGLDNLIEYALGTDPMISNPSPVIRGRTLFEEQTYFTLTITKNPSATDAVLTAVASNGLDSGSWSSNGLIIESNTATELRVRDSQPMQATARRFFRVQVVR